MPGYAARAAERRRARLGRTLATLTAGGSCAALAIIFASTLTQIVDGMPL